jgi:hypothetical protein
MVSVEFDSEVNAMYIRYDFYLIGHEHLYVFRKPEAEERMTRFRESMKW